MADETQQQVTMQFEIIKHVTLPLMKLGAEASFLKFIGKIFQAENTGKPREGADGNKMAPPELAHVQDLVRNIPAQVIINSVLGSELRKAYPEDAYVGKTFRIAKTGVPGQGKRYATYEILEVKLKESPDAGKGAAKK